MVRPGPGRRPAGPSHRAGRAQVGRDLRHLARPHAAGRHTLHRTGARRSPVADEDQCFGDAGGALVGGGKLIAISATRATGCVAGGVRLYTRISSYRSTITDWARDVDLDERISGSVLAREPSDLIDLCTTNQQGKLDGCYVDRMGSMLDWDDDFDFLTQLGDLGDDGKGDLLARTPGGTLYRIPNPLAYGEVGDAPKVKLGTGWSKYNKIVAARDLSGDGLPDILARDTSGVVWLHRGRSDGSLAGRTKVTTWKSYTAIAGRGDLSGDGRADIVTRDGAGVLWLYRGNGKGGFSPRTKIGSGWGKYNAIVGSGDMDHNGRQDILARTPAGAVYLYNANHTGASRRRRSWPTPAGRSTRGSAEARDARLG